MGFTDLCRRDERRRQRLIDADHRIQSVQNRERLIDRLQASLDEAHQETPALPAAVEDGDLKGRQGRL